MASPVAFACSGVIAPPYCSESRIPGPESRVAGPRSQVPPLSRQLPVLDPMRRIRLGSQAAPAIRLVVLIVALEPDDAAVALEGEHVRGNAVEEPAIVADHHRAAGVVEERLLERAQRVDVEVVGRLVQQ